MRIVTLVGWLLVSTAVVSSSQDRLTYQAGPGVWAKAALELSERPSDSPIMLSNPDRRCDLAVVITGGRFSVMSKGIERLQGAVDLVAELLWAPDCQGFASTSSQGGTIGPFVVNVYSVGPAGDVSDHYLWPLLKPVVSRDRANCEANIAAGAWKTGDELLVVTQVPGITTCNHPGVIRGYLVSLRRKEVVKSYTLAQLKREFSSSLGAFVLTQR